MKHLQIALVSLIFAVLGPGQSIWAENGPGIVSPQVFGLDIPIGQPVPPPAGARVQTHNEDRLPVVAKLHVTVGKHAVVMLPDGRLVARRNAEIAVTKKPFLPIAKDKLSEKILAEEFKGFKTLESRRYLYVYNTSEGFARAASRILESMYPGISGYAELQRFEIHEPIVPLVVVMFRKEAEFQKYRRMPPGLVAYYNTLSNRVVMYEESQVAKVKPELAIQQSISTIAHEGVHQILHNIGVQQRLSQWPMWLSEGLAEYFAPTSLDKNLAWKGAGQVNDLRMFELEHYLKNRKPDNAGEMVQHTVAASRLSSTGYASAWSLTHYLSKNRRKEFNRYLQDVGKLAPLEGPTKTLPPGIIPGNLADFQEHFGEDILDLERRLILHLRAQPYNDPFAEWPHFVAVVALPIGRSSKRYANTFHAHSTAQKWVEQRRAMVNPELRPKVTSNIHQFENRLLAEQFANRWLNAK